MATTFVVACPGNSVSAPSGTICDYARTCSDGALRYWQYAAVLAADGSLTSGWRFVGTTCRGSLDTQASPPVAVPVVTLKDLKALPLSGGVVHVQPVSTQVLVNYPTNVYADADELTLPTTVLGQPVRVRATPTRFRWTFGDGHHLDTNDPGAPWPDLRTTHEYTRAGRYPLTLVTYYRGEYSVNGGPWLRIDGEADVTSATTTLTAYTGHNELVADTLG